MKLLDAKQVKTEKDKVNEKRIETVTKLNSEISKLTRDLNNLKLKVFSEEKRVAEYIAKSEGTLKVKKSILEIEVVALEKRKDVSLAPIRIMKEDAERLFQEHKEMLNEVKIRKDALIQNEEKLLEQAESMNELESSLLDKKEELNVREIGVVSSEQEIARSSKSLASDWLKFHETVHKSNAEIDRITSELNRRQKYIDDSRKVNESVRMSNEAESKRLKEEDRAIKDKYVALEQAKKHLGIK